MKAHPVVGGRPLLLGDRVVANRGSEYYERRGEVTSIRVRCCNDHGMEEVLGPGLEKCGEREREQVWVSLDNTNSIYYADQLEREE